MPLRIVSDGGIDRPLVSCDYCRHTIDDATDGNYQWIHGEGTLYFTHKQCCHAFEQARPGDWSADELQFLPLFLGNSLHVNWKKANSRARLLASLRFC
jgi:hypothetical protein